MNLASMDQILQLVAWFLALIEFILALYVLLLNAWHTANRHVSLLLLILAGNTLGVGLMLGATSVGEAALGTYLLSATNRALGPMLLLVTIALLKPRWLRGQWRWAWWPVYLLVFVPAFFTALDVGLGTRLWFTGLDPETYTGGYVSSADFVGGSLYAPFRILSAYVITLATLVPILYVALRDKQVTPLTRRLAWLLFGTQLGAIVIQIGLRALLSPAQTVLITSTLFAIVYAYSAFQQMLSERRAQRGQLQLRLTALIVVVTGPILVAALAVVGTGTRTLVGQAIAGQPEAELLSALRQFQTVSWLILAGGVALLSLLTWLTIRQAIRPVGTLTETTAAIAAGDLSRVAPVESEDEFGLLARTFNSMTEQLRELVGNLEQQVAERTHDLEHRSAYLEATAEVGRAAGSILDPGQLIQQVVELIRERFGLYYVGLFLVDEAREWAVLRAGTGEAGRRMLDRGHQIRVGEGMIGWSISRGQPRVALEVGEDAVRLATVELPDTRSEAALPLRSRGQVLGALTVQHSQPDAFDEATMAVLQIMADQVAVALDNANLFVEGQQALETARRAYGEVGEEAWAELLRVRAGSGYRYAHRAVESVDGDWRPEMLQAEQMGRKVQLAPERGERAKDVSDPRLAIPIKVRDQVVGVLGLRKAEVDETWTDEEMAVLETMIDQLGVALESARLYQDTQRRAAREQLLGEIAARVRESLDVDTVLQTAVRETRGALDIAKVEVLLEPAARPETE